MHSNRLVKLGDVCKVISGYAFKSASFKDGGTTPVLKIKNIKVGTASLVDAGYVSNEFIGKIAPKFHIIPDDILISLTGSHMSQPNSVVGRVGRYPKDYPLALLNQRAGKVIPDISLVDSTYLFYVLLGDDIRKEIAQMASGAASQANISPSQVESVKILLPLMDIQIKIGSLLQKYDNLIENNNRRIAILEDMAQSLYREWFVNFRYPGHADTVDDSLPDALNESKGTQKLIDSPLGQIPEGWEVKELKGFCSKIGSGATPRGGKGAYKKEGIPLIRSMNIYDSSLITKNLAYIDDEQAARLKNVIVEPNDVLLNITGASVARCSIVPTAYTPARVNQHVAIIRLNTPTLSAEYLMYTLISKNGKARLLSTAQGGATREALTKTDIEKFKVVVPPNDVIEKFNSLVKGVVKLKEVLFLKNENLKKQRDMLLPKLISGQIEL
jgi:type I restriction enzyme S subunit